MKKVVLPSVIGVLFFILLSLSSPYSRMGQKLFASPRHKIVMEMARNGDLSGIYKYDGFEMDDRQLIFNGDTLTYRLTAHLDGYQRNEMSFYVRSHDNYSWRIASDKYGNIQNVNVYNDDQTVFEYHCYKLFFLKDEESFGKKEFYPVAQKMFNAVTNDVLTKSNQ